MSELGIAPEALQGDFIDGVTNYLTDRQFDKLNARIERAGIIQDLGHKALTTPWQAFMEVTDSITGAEVLSQSGDALTMRIDVDDNDANKVALYNVFDATFNGIRVDKPRIWPEQQSLTIERLTYADVSSIGRICTALLHKELEETLGPNIHLVHKHTINAIKATSVKQHLPEILKDRIAYHERTFGEEQAGQMLLTTGHVGIMGRKAREALAGRKLPIQRHRHNRPNIEEKITFLPDESADIPTSRMTMRGTLKGQIHDRMDQLTQPYKERNFVEASEALWDILTGLGLTQGVGSAVRAISAVTIASGASAWTTMRNKRQLLRAQQKP